jgi:hypothetical protein
MEFVRGESLLDPTQRLFNLSRSRVLVAAIDFGDQKARWR